MENGEKSVIVSGAGPAGLAAACLVALTGASVRLVTGPGVSPNRHDPRTIALMQASINALAHIGVWPEPLKMPAQALRKLRLIDDTGQLLSAPTLTFSASEIGADAFGWNIPVEKLTRALMARARNLGVEIVEASVKSAEPGDSAVRIVLDSGQQITAAAVIAADGQSSPVRHGAGIGTVDWAYDQTAIAGSFGHSGPHGDMSSEYHKQAGPLTTVPMPDGLSAFVWMERPARAAELMTMDEAAFARTLQFETHGDLGAISSIGPRRAFAMRGLTARQFAGSRVMLVGEAAHVVPPIGAQGLNMSLRDAALAAELIGDALAWDEDIGADRVMKDYDRRRRADVAPRQAVIHGMNTSLLSEHASLHALRATGLSLIDKFAPLRQRVMREGLAPASDLPRVMLG